jgi:hypothetical protein
MFSYLERTHSMWVGQQHLCNHYKKNCDSNHFKGLIPATWKLDSANRHSSGVSHREKSGDRPVEDPKHMWKMLWASNLTGYPVGIFLWCLEILWEVSELWTQSAKYLQISECVYGGMPARGRFFQELGSLVQNCQPPPCKLKPGGGPIESHRG